MYLSGSFTDFESRLHQLPETTGDIALFVSEGRGYLASGTGIVSVQRSGHWEREARKRTFLITDVTGDLLVQQF